MTTQLLPAGGPPPQLGLHDVAVVVHPDVWAHLPESSADMLQHVLDCGNEVARERRVSLERVNVRLDLTDTDMVERQVVVSFWVRVSMTEAFAYLDEVDTRVQSPLALLGAEGARTYRDRVTLQAQWL